MKRRQLPSAALRVVQIVGVTLVALRALSLHSHIQNDVAADSWIGMALPSDMLPSTQSSSKNASPDAVLTDCASYNVTLDGLRAPTFIIAGAQKAGTSALYHLLQKHPDIQSSVRFEPHFFDSRKKERQILANSNQTVICQKRQDYLKEFDIEKLLQSNDTISFEKSPVYICKSQIPGLVKRIAPWAKIVLVLRNPVDRAYSAWGMMHRDRKTDIGFDELIQGEVKRLRGLKVSRAPRVAAFDVNATGQQHRRQNLKFQNIPISLEERASKGVTYESGIHEIKRKNFMCSFLSRGMYAQQLLNWMDHYKIGIDLKIIRYEEFLENRSVALNDLLDFVGASSHIDLDDTLLEQDYRPHKNRTIEGGAMNPVLRSYLKAFYKPYNDELADLLGVGWRDVWT